MLCEPGARHTHHQLLLLLLPLLVVVLQVLVAVLEHTPDSIDLVKMQEELVGAARSYSALLVHSSCQKDARLQLLV